MAALAWVAVMTVSAPTSNPSRPTSLFDGCKSDSGAQGDLGTCHAAAGERVSTLEIEKGSPVLVERRRMVDQHGSRIATAETHYVDPMYSRSADACALARR